MSQKEMDFLDSGGHPDKERSKRDQPQISCACRCLVNRNFPGTTLLWGRLTAQCPSSPPPALPVRGLKGFSRRMSQ